MADSDHGGDPGGAVIHVCRGASTSKCACRCPDSCEHVWDGPYVDIEGGYAVTCSRCGMDSLTHSMWTLP